MRACASWRCARQSSHSRLRACWLPSQPVSMRAIKPFVASEQQSLQDLQSDLRSLPYLVLLLILATDQLIGKAFAVLEIGWRKGHIDLVGTHALEQLDSLRSTSSRASGTRNLIAMCGANQRAADIGLESRVCVSYVVNHTSVTRARSSKPRVSYVAATYRNCRQHCVQLLRLSICPIDCCCVSGLSQCAPTPNGLRTKHAHDEAPSSPAFRVQ